jgi:ABC-type sugar transport system ATPase subunit
MTLSTPAARADTVPRLLMTGIDKRFPGVHALKHVDLDVLPGEIHALVGENGAGKSTLMNIIAGVHRPDMGTIALDGSPVVISDERTATTLGIGMVHQEQSLVPRLSIAENIFGGHPPVDRFRIIDRATMVREARALMQRLQSSIDPRRRVDSLSPAQRQTVEIAKALAQPLRLLILDEPTAALTLAEARHLFAVTRQLADDGVGILFVSHRLAEVFQIASRVTVLKDGAVTGVLPTTDITTDELMHLMVGRELSFDRDPRRVAEDAPVALEVRDLTAPPIHNVSLKVRRGEIVCLAGLVGAGRTELVETIFGARRIDSGSILIDGRAVRHRTPRDAVRSGLAMVPEDRKEAGLFLDMTVEQNMASANLDLLSDHGLVSWARLARLADSFIASLRIRTPDRKRRILFLSGGNQQKVLLARWLMRQPPILIVDEPTRGVDVGAKSEIYRILRQLAEQGTAFLVVSSDMPEVLALAHQIVVLSEGAVAGTLDAADADETAVLRLAAPVRRDQQEAAA